jgi:hypothetical protein
MELLRGKTGREATKTMMFDHDLPNSLWEEATFTAVYI